MGLPSTLGCAVPARTERPQDPARKDRAGQYYYSPVVPLVLHRAQGVLHRVLRLLHRVLHRVIGVLHRVLGVLHRVLGVLHWGLGVLHSALTVLRPAQSCSVRPSPTPAPLSHHAPSPACRQFLYGAPDWKIAASVIKDGAGFEAQRYMDDPHADGRSADGCTHPFDAQV